MALKNSRKADFKARVKKIEIANRVLAGGWDQSIRIVLGDIELTNQNLLEVKQFKPNEDVLVEITPVQVIPAGLEGPPAAGAEGSASGPKESAPAGEPEDGGELFELHEGGGFGGGEVVRRFDFGRPPGEGRP